MIKRLSDYHVEGFDNVMSALLIENNLSGNDLNKLFPDQASFYPKTFESFLAAMKPLNNEKVFVDTLKAFNKNDEICVAGDYDGDGIMATVTMLLGLRYLGYHCHFKIPNRFDGYGATSLEDDIIKKKTKLIITVDNGVSLKDMVENAKSNNVSVIVTDHHLPDPEQTPDCPIIDPKFNGDEFSDICGAFVALKLIYALYKEVAPSKINYVNQLAPLAGIATVADMMPMLQENRILVKLTLNQMNYIKSSNEFSPLKKILFSLGGYKFFTIDDQVATEELISFSIAPAINAVSRVNGDVTDLVRDIVKVLTEPFYKMPNYYQFNITRQKRTLEMINDFKRENENNLSEVFVYDKNMYNFEIRGILGLIANKVSHNNNIIALVGAEKENGKIIDFSGRSVVGYDLHEGVKRIKMAHPELNIAGGGHSNAMGIRIDNTPENLKTLKEALEEDVKNYSAPVEPTQILFDEDAYDQAVPVLEKLQPFGQGFQKLHFVYEGKFTEYDGNEKYATIGDYYFRAFLNQQDLDKYLRKDVIVEFTMSFDSKAFEVVLNVSDIKEKSE